MTQRSERIAVFVTRAQKRALATKAQSLGISISELVRRAVLAFDETAEDVRAARIVDSWRVPAATDSLNETLRRIASAPPLQASAALYRAAQSVSPSDAPAVSASGDDSEPGESIAAAPAPIPVAAAVAQALACEPVDAAGTEDSEPPPALDLETVTRLTSRWSETSAGGTADTPDTAHTPDAAPPRRKRFVPRLA